MEFVYSEEQQMLADMVSRWLTDTYDFAARRKLIASEAGFSEANWHQLAEMGLLGLNVPAAHGGQGATPVETLIVMQKFGGALLVEPFFSTAVVGAALLSRAGTAAQQAEILPMLAAGARRLALATLEPGARYDLASIGTTAKQSAGSFLLNGRKAVALDAGSAHALVVAARTSGAVNGRAGITLFLVDAATPGLEVRDFPTIDGRRAAEVMLTDVVLPGHAVLGELDAGYDLLEWVTDIGLAALCAEAVGAMERLSQLTAEHLRTRKQFGQEIGRFQALQHRFADMQIAIEQARSMALLAAAKADHPLRSERRKSISAAKSMIGRSGRLVGQLAVQLHGGMGMTDELPVGDYFKRLTCIDLTWGNTEHHCELYGEFL